MHTHGYTYMHTYIVAEQMAQYLRTLTEHPDSVLSPGAYCRLYLQLQRIHCPLLMSTGVGYTCSTHTYMHSRHSCT